MRPGGRVDDRVGALALELVVVPARPLAAVVLGVADPDRLLVQRLGGRGRVEDELDHLPVALVQVVELVEVVEEPVLEGELSRRVRLGHDVRVGDGGVTLAERDGVAGVGAPGIEGAPGVVEAPLGALAEEVGGGRRRRPRVVRRSAQHDVPAPEDDLDRRGDVLLAAGVARRVLLLLDLQEGGEALGQPLLVRRRGTGGGRERQQQAQGQQQARRAPQMVPLAIPRGRTADASSSSVKLPVAPLPTA